MITVTQYSSQDCHHTEDYPEDLTGMTLRQALRALRAVNWGNIGGTHAIELSDGTTIRVELQAASDGGQLMSSQRIVRHYYDYDRGDEFVLRAYPV